MTQPPRLGKLPPMYPLLLNQHPETRVSSCPYRADKMRPAGWYSDEQMEAEEREIAQARAEFAARNSAPPPARRNKRRK